MSGFSEIENKTKNKTKTKTLNHKGHRGSQRNTKKNFGFLDSVLLQSFGDGINNSGSSEGRKGAQRKQCPTLKGEGHKDSENETEEI
ncbi:MAG: hypothetical protein JWO13_1179 [Acidobacteriales bacterium]|nr:hypothetical protein [Terriglobales bacterium]